MKSLAALKLWGMVMLAGVVGTSFADEPEKAAEGKLAVGDVAPDFTLPDQDGKMHALSKYRGRWVLIYFYPKDDTPGCTQQACELRDRSRDLAKLKVQVLGINTDSVPSHKSFAKKHKLKFPLLSDKDQAVVAAYGVKGQFKFMGMGLTGRWTYLVKPDGTIAKIYEQVDPARHADEVLKDLAELGAGQKK